MKSYVKQRQELIERVADIHGGILYLLGELRKKGWGAGRLHDLYDSVMLEMYKDVCYHRAGIRLGVGDDYARFAMDFGLSFEEFQKRQQKAIEAFEKELFEKVEAERKARQEWKERFGNNGDHR